MNIKLAKEIYGNAWFIDPLSLSQFSKTLDYFQSGGVFDENEPKANAFGIIDQSQVFNARRISRMEVVPQGTIAQYNFDSVITKHGGMSHFGTQEIASQFSDMELNENVIGHIFKIESGGGSSNAIKYIRDVSSKANRKKPLIVYSEDIMASAAMYIASDADYIIVNSKEALVGSIGTMIQLEGFKNGSEDSTGKRHLRIYASQSVNKNKEFENAINDLNFDLIRSKLLDPHAATFIKDMEANRPNITAIQKTGAIFRAEEAVGTLIDEIGTYQMAIDKVYELNGSKPPQKTEDNNNLKKESMDYKQLKSEHPSLFAQVLDEGKELGKSEEKDRVGAWAVFNEINPEKVKAGIESGLPLSAKAMAEFNLESVKGKKVKAIVDENAGATNTPKEVKSAEDIQAEANKTAMEETFGKGEDK